MVILLGLLLLIPLSGYADDDNVFEASKTTSVLGQPLGGRVTAGTPDGLQQVQSSTIVDVVGKALTPLQSFINPPMTIDGTTYVEVYSFGSRVFHQSYYHSNNGILSFEAGFVPTEVRVPVFTYPVGPLVVEVGAGARFQADVQGQLNPTIMFPASMSILQTKLSANATVAGFVEGDAKLIFVRAGVGGEAQLVDMKGQMVSEFFFNGQKPATQFGIYAAFLRGKIYSFVDFYNLFQAGWSRLWENDFWKYQGLCVSKGNLQCPAY